MNGKIPTSHAPGYHQLGSNFQVSLDRLSLPSIHLEDCHDPLSFLSFSSIPYIQIMADADDEQHNQQFEQV